MTSYNPIITLYEDSRGDVTEFGLHKLVVRCIFDEINGEFYMLNQALKDCRPMKGDSSLLGACGQVGRLIGRGGEPVVAVFDHDKICTLLRLSHDASEDEILEEIQQRSTESEQLRVFLLQENTESLLEVIAQHDPDISDRQRIEAIEKKSLNARDAIFHAAAKEAKKAVREQLLEENPSFELLIQSIAHWVQS